MDGPDRPDVAFQREEDRSLQANLGFVAIRSSRAVADFFRIVGEVLAQKRKGVTGDQRIITKALPEPWWYPRPSVGPRFAWSLERTESSE